MVNEESVDIFMYACVFDEQLPLVGVFQPSLSRMSIGDRCSHNAFTTTLIYRLEIGIIMSTSVVHDAGHSSPQADTGPPIFYVSAR